MRINHSFSQYSFLKFICSLYSSFNSISNTLSCTLLSTGHKQELTARELGENSRKKHRHRNYATRLQQVRMETAILRFFLVLPLGSRWH